MKKGKLKFLSLFMVLALGIAMGGCGGKTSDQKNNGNKENTTQEESNTATGTTTDTPDKAKGNNPVVTIKIKDYGTMKGELYPELAPNTVKNFIALANSGFYNGLTFHRVIPGFMIQGGDPKGNGTGGPGYSIKGEFASNGFENDLRHTEGVLSMARSKSKDSAGSQFFIMTADAPHLDGEYAAFGKITEGLDVLHKIEKTETDSKDKPLKDIVIESISVDTKGVNYGEPDKM